MKNLPMLQKIKEIPWSEPLNFLQNIAARGDDFAFLYSSRQDSPSSNFSYLAFEPIFALDTEDANQAAALFTQENMQLESAFFGVLGYGLKNQLEKLPAEKPGKISMSSIRLRRYRQILLWDHRSKKLSFWSDNKQTLPPSPASMPESKNISAPISLLSDRNKAEYIADILQILSAIKNGDLYQANLTRKYFGIWEKVPEMPALFARLCKESPSSYSALLRFGDSWILSSSPESFLKSDGKKIIMQPIKGSIKRSADKEQDKYLQEMLQSSKKDQAENLMIVDLCRHDIAKYCQPGTVDVPQLFALESYATIHHLVSTITGELKAGATSWQALLGCFPPGSMTGAPKIQAMKLCHQLEPFSRGVYSGALGLIGGDGSLDMSVVIRTLIAKGNEFEFQVGGGIVADSNPELEWQETLVKARGILAALAVENFEQET